MLRVVTAVQEIMTEFNGAVSEEDKIVLNILKQRWPLEFIGPTKS
jgi:hypothetical protein